MCSPLFLSPSLSLTINLLTHDYVSHTFVFPLVQTCTSTWALHSKLQSTRLSLCDSRDTVRAPSSFMHSLNSALWDGARWKPEIAHNIHSPQERSTTVCLKSSPHGVYLILQVNTVVGSPLAIVGGLESTDGIVSLWGGGFCRIHSQRLQCNVPARSAELWNLLKYVITSNGVIRTWSSR